MGKNKRRRSQANYSKLFHHSKIHLFFKISSDRRKMDSYNRRKDWKWCPFFSNLLLQFLLLGEKQSFWGLNYIYDYYINTYSSDSEKLKHLFYRKGKILWASLICLELPFWPKSAQKIWLTTSRFQERRKLSWKSCGFLKKICVFFLFILWKKKTFIFNFWFDSLNIDCQKIIWQRWISVWLSLQK